MADFTTISDGAIDANSPITAELMAALRDNPLSMGEGSSTVPNTQQIWLNIEEDVDITGASSYTTATLDLTKLGFLYFSFKQVSCTLASANIRINGGLANVNTLSSAATNYDFSCIVDVYSGNCVTWGDGSVANVGTGVDAADTTLAVSTTSGTFDNGTLTIRGWR